MGKKNSKGGKGHRKMGKKNAHHDTKNTLILKEEGEEYVKVAQMLGGGRMYVTFPDGSQCIGIIPGRMRKKRFWISVGDIVLVSIRDYQEDRCDVIHRYNQEQVRILKKQGDISFSLDGVVEGDHDPEFGVDFSEDANPDSIEMGNYSTATQAPVSAPVAVPDAPPPVDTTLDATTDGHVFDIDEI